MDHNTLKKRVFRQGGNSFIPQRHNCSLGVIKLRIKETSKIEVYIDGEKLDYSPQSVTDATERAVNRVLEGAKKAEIVEKIMIEPQ